MRSLYSAIGMDRKTWRPEIGVVFKDSICTSMVSHHKHRCRAAYTQKSDRYLLMFCTNSISILSSILLKTCLKPGFEQVCDLGKSAIKKVWNVSQTCYICLCGGATNNFLGRNVSGFFLLKTSRQLCLWQDRTHGIWALLINSCWSVFQLKSWKVNVH